MDLYNTTRNTFFLAILLSSAVPAASGQTIWYIDADVCPKTGSGTQEDPFCRIHSAIFASSDGDELIAAPGLYIENLNFFGKAITLRSEGPDVIPITIIDGSDPGHAELGSTVRFVSAESSSTVLDGFSIKGGSGTIDSSGDRVGGGILCLFNASPTIRNCIIVANEVADGFGGGLYSKGADIELHDCLFTANTAVFGGGLYVEDGLLTMTGCTVRDNGAYGIRCDDANMSNCLIEDNTDGGIFADNVVLTDCQIVANTGPGLLCYIGHLSNCLIEDNYYSGLGSSHAGGVAFWSDTPSTLTNCTISGNFSHWVGGIRCTNATIKDCTITGNHSDTRAGGIHLNEDSEAVISNCTIANNIVDSVSGGAVHISSGGQPIIEGCRIVDNTSMGINSLGSNAVITNCLIAGNYLDGLNLRGFGAAPMVKDCVIVGNLGGILGSSGYVVDSCLITGTTARPAVKFNGGPDVPTLRNSLLVGNMARAMFCNSRDPIISNTLVVGNASVGLGGAAYLTDNCDMTVRGSTFVDNVAEGGGNSFAFDTPIFSSTLTVQNSLLRDGDDAILILDESTVEITHSDVEGGWPGVGNIDEDPQFVGAVHTGTWTSNAVYLEEDYQSRLTDNTASWPTGALAGMLLNPAIAQSRQFFIVDNTETTITVWGDVTPVSSGDSFEVFDYHLSFGSLAINAGDPDFIPEPDETDIDGDPRMLHGRVDMGADEFRSCPGDLDGDGLVGAGDLALLLGAWGECSNCPADFNGDDLVGPFDLAILLGGWGACP